MRVHLSADNAVTRSNGTGIWSITHGVYTKRFGIISAVNAAKSFIGKGIGSPIAEYIGRRGHSNVINVAKYSNKKKLGIITSEKYTKRFATIGAVNATRSFTR